MNPVFLIGSGRSGTTFLQRIFDSHPDTLCLHEPDTLLRTTNPPPVPQVADYPELMAAATAYIDQLLRIRGLRAVQKQPTFAKSYRGPGARKLREASIHLLQALETGLGRRVSFWNVPDFADTSRATIVLKSVESGLRLPLFALARPDMKFINILRHPCGVVSSIIRGHDAGKMPAPVIYEAQLVLPLAQEHGLTREKIAGFDPLTTAAWSWTLNNDFTIRQIEGLSNIRLLLYDAFCGDLMEQSRELFEWCGMSLHPQTEEFLARLLGHKGQTHAYHDTVRNPRSAAHRWRQQVSEAEKSRIMEIARLSPAGRAFDAVDRSFLELSDRQEQ